MLTPLMAAITPLPVSVPLDMFITPSTFFNGSSNGTYTSPYFTSTASGGEQPYLYEWSVSGDFSLYLDASNTTRVRANGYDTVAIGTLSCTVTDDDLNTITKDVSLTVIFGTGYY